MYHEADRSACSSMRAARWFISSLSGDHARIPCSFRVFERALATEDSAAALDMKTVVFLPLIIVEFAKHGTALEAALKSVPCPCLYQLTRFSEGKVEPRFSFAGPRPLVYTK